AQVLRGEPQVIEEGARVAIAFIELVPEAANAALVEVARGERRLAASRGTGDPHHRAFAAAVEQAEEALSRQHAGKARARSLAERSPLRLHRPPQPPAAIVAPSAALRNALAARVGAAAPAPGHALDAMPAAFQLHQA